MTDDAPVKGAPPNGPKYGQINETLADMIELAIADIGEWYSIPLPDGKPGGFASTAAQVLGRQFADISTKGGRLWIRIKP